MSRALCGYGTVEEKNRTVLGSVFSYSSLFHRCVDVIGSPFFWIFTHWCLLHTLIDCFSFLTCQISRFLVRTRVSWSNSTETWRISVCLNTWAKCHKFNVWVINVCDLRQVRKFAKLNSPQTFPATCIRCPLLARTTCVPMRTILRSWQGLYHIHGRFGTRITTWKW